MDHHPHLKVTEELSGTAHRRAFVVEELLPQSAARAWSRETGGMVFWSRYALTVLYGDHSTTYVPATVHDPIAGVAKPLLPALKAAHTCAAELIGEEPGWAYPRIARRLIAWLALGQSPLAIDLKPIMLPDWHYQRVIPGAYEDCSLYDLTAAYWQIVEHARSPLFTFSRDLRRIYWHALSQEQQQRWETLKTVVKPHKRLRLAIVGASSAGWSDPKKIQDGYAVYSKGEPVTGGVPPTQLQPLALLAVRCTYELCQIQSEPSGIPGDTLPQVGRGSLYSNADCVVLQGQADGDVPAPAYWQSLGLEYRLKAQGPGRIHAIYARWIGDDDTAPRRAIGDRNIWIACQSKRLADPTLHLQVLGNRHQRGNKRAWSTERRPGDREKVAGR